MVCRTAGFCGRCVFVDLLDLQGVGLEVAGALVVVAGDNPERLRSEASFAALCGVTPLPASSGKTTRHRLNRGDTFGPPTRCIATLR